MELDLITNNTVFVLGAGASWHYGYPTGEALVEDVVKMSRLFESYCRNRCSESLSGAALQAVPEYVSEKIDRSWGLKSALQGWEAAANESMSLAERLETVRPLLIDHFLAWNESLRPIGKLMIAAVLLECEASWLHSRRNKNRSKDDKSKDDWYRFITHKIVYNCERSSDIFNNNVKFITFNYDTSLEYVLYNSISSMDLFTAEDVSKFLSEDRIVHVYGAVDSDFAKNAASNELGLSARLSDPYGNTLNHQPQIQSLIDRCYTSAKRLRTVDPHDKEEDAAALQTAKKWIEDAGVVYILGYGFDDSNNARIGLTNLRHDKRDVAVMFTNYGNLNVINKKASKLFFGQPTSFLEGYTCGNMLQGFYAEKSIRNVYDALSTDFDALENELTASTRI